MKNPLFFILFCFTLFFSEKVVAAETLLYTPDEQKKIVVNNRILAKINGKSVSVYDVMKKMDMLFYRQFPEYTSSTVARYQFYSANWEHVLQDLVDKELIMADAEEAKMQVSKGDVRQEMESMFGPSIILNLDKAGLSYDEAWKMVQSDIIIKRMLFSRANAKALKKITPQVIKQAYEEYAKANIQPDRLVYTVISIRDKNKQKGAEAANQAYQLITNEKIALQDLTVKLSSLSSVAKSSKVTVSEEFRHAFPELSESYKNALSPLKPNESSQPIAQKSRTDGSTVYRIFYLKAKEAGGAPPFNEVANTLKDKLLDEEASLQIDLYLNKLRKHFDVQGGQVEELKKEAFEPFALG